MFDSLACIETYPHDEPGEQPDLAALVEADPRSMGDEEARLHLIALHRAKARLDGAVVVATGVVDRRGLHRADAARSCAGWLAARVDQHRGRCGADVRLARSLAEMPVTEASASAGRLGRAKVALLAEARTDAVADVFALHEEWLVDEVERLTVADAATFLAAWHQKARLAVGDTDPDDAPDTGEPPRATVDLSRTFEGRWALDGAFDPECGTVLHAAITAEVDEMFRVGVFTADDGLSPGERRGLALAQLVARKARAGTKHDQPRPSVEVICDEDTLVGLPVTDPADDDGDDLRSRVCELVDGTPISHVTLSRLLCGARIHRLVVSATGEVLDAGRDIRYANRAQRRALRFRHARHCAFPGCTAPMDWCEAHHIDDWDHDGPTDMANLVPLCRFHHHRVHEGGFTLALTPDGQVTATRPPDPGGGRCRTSPTKAHRRPREPHPEAALVRERLRELVASRA